jgi:hypothetical protein
MDENNKKPHDGSYKKKWNGKKKHCSKPAAPPEKFKGGKEELDGNYFDCAGCGQSDRFVKTVQKIADCIGQACKVGGVTRTEVITQAATIIPMPTRPMTTTMHCASWEDSRCSKGERTMKVKAETCC